MNYLEVFFSPLIKPTRMSDKLHLKTALPGNWREDIKMHMSSMSTYEHVFICSSCQQLQGSYEGFLDAFNEKSLRITINNSQEQVSNSYIEMEQIFPSYQEIHKV